MPARGYLLARRLRWGSTEQKAGMFTVASTLHFTALFPVTFTVGHLKEAYLFLRHL